MKLATTSLLLATCLLGSVDAFALGIYVTDDEGQPLPNTAVQVFPLDDANSVGQNPARQDQAEPFAVAQIARQFDPLVSVVPTGATIAFPNRDRVSHHVYSFSPAKRFELELYKGEMHEPLQFDVAGVVTLGCNIHDKMRGYIVVTSAPWFGLTDDEGRLELELPRQKYQIEFWHPRQIEGQSLSVDAATNPDATVNVQLAVKPERPVRRGLGSLSRSKP